MANFSKLNIGDRVASSGLRRFRKLSVEQLPSPYGVSLDGDYLTWGDYSCFATSFDILVDGVVKATVSAPTNSFDLSTLGLSDGTYSISVVSKAEGYLDSDPSEAVSYEVADDSLVGTWVLNAVCNPADESFSIKHNDLDITFGFFNGSTAVQQKVYNLSIYAKTSDIQDIWVMYTLDDINQVSNYARSTYTRYGTSATTDEYYLNYYRKWGSSWDKLYSRTYSEANVPAGYRKLVISSEKNLTSSQITKLGAWLKANATKQ